MKKILKIEGMSCHHCEMRVENALKSLKDVKKAKANYAEGLCVIELKNDIADDILINTVMQAGYTLTKVEG